MTLNLKYLLQQYDPDLLLTYNWGTVDAVAAAALIGNRRVIHTEDGFGHDEASRQKRRRILYRRLVLPTAHCVIAPSRTLYNTMEQLWRLPLQKLRYIPNGVDVSRFPRASRGGSISGLVIGTVGALRPEKHYETLLEICAALVRLRPLELVIVGDGPERAVLERRAASLGITERVKFLGHRHDATAIYQDFDIFALTSSTEQMPLSVLEAMCSGLPIVSTDVGDIRTMVSSANEPFVATGANDLFTALSQLLDNRGLRLRIGEANRSHCISAFGIDRMFAQYQNVYSEALCL
jgi:glycosyltransferase involved in cell wall biosynthesis